MKSKEFKRALVTGASKGIGRELSKFLAEKGIDLIVVARSRGELESLSREIGGKVSVDIVEADLADREQRKNVLKAIHEKVPDLVVNNAGWGYYGEALTYETEASLNMLDVDVSALLEISLESARSLVTAEKEGVIMNVSSTAAFLIFPGFSVYSASKAFVNRFSESFDEELKPCGIRVLACCPGMVDTQFRKRASGGEAREADPMSMTTEFAVGEIWKQILSGQKIRAFDWKMRVAAFLTQYVLPKSLVSRIVQRRIDKIHSSKEIIKVKKKNNL